MKAVVIAILAALLIGGLYAGSIAVERVKVAAAKVECTK
jgi:hypothetical protein